MMRSLILALSLAAIMAPAAPALADRHDDQRREQAERRDQREWRKDVREARKDRRDVRNDRRDVRNDRREAWRDYNRYDYNRPDPRTGRYYADSYYREGGNYKARRLGSNDRIYRGSNGRYYCRRDDGTTGLIVGGIGGGVLGNAIAPGDSKTLGTILGAGLGAIIGKSIDRNNVTCR